MEQTVLKADSFGRILLIQRQGTVFIRRDLSLVRSWLRPLAGWLLRREAKALQHLNTTPHCPRLIHWTSSFLDRSYLRGAPLYCQRPFHQVAYFYAAHRLLRTLHRQGVVHNDLAKEANWLVLESGGPALIDFQLALRGRPRARWVRLLAREDLRHLLKHKRTYCQEHLTPTERRILARPSWIRQLWFWTGKPCYRWVTRSLIGWQDREGKGPGP